MMSQLGKGEQPRGGKSTSIEGMFFCVNQFALGGQPCQANNPGEGRPHRLVAQKKRKKKRDFRELEWRAHIIALNSQLGSRPSACIKRRRRRTSPPGAL